MRSFGGKYLHESDNVINKILQKQIWAKKWNAWSGILYAEEILKRKI